MTLRSYLITMLVATAICWIGWAVILVKVDPETTNLPGFALFYASFFLAATGSAAIIGFLIRFIALKQELLFRSVKDAFRQSFLFAFLLAASLFLLSKNLFSWLNLLFLITGLSLLEYFMISYKRGT